jgi:hypothetical protein
MFGSGSSGAPNGVTAAGPSIDFEEKNLWKQAKRCLLRKGLPSIGEKVNDNK